MRFRPAVPDDAPAVLAVLAARNRADLGEVDYTLEDLRDEWRGLDLDLDRDVRVVEADDGQIAAYAVVRAFGSMAAVAPEHEGRGIGSRLLSRVATREGKVVGFLLARRWREEPVGFVDILAVHPEHQGHGLGATLLRSVFAAFAAEGLREAQLGVSSVNARGLRLYERAGMTVRHRAVIYERPAGS